MLKNVLKTGLVLGGLIASVAGYAACVVTGRTCTDPGGTRLVNGISVTRDCWGYTETKTCYEEDATLAANNGCATLQADADTGGVGNCRRVDTTCTEPVEGMDGTSVCGTEKQTWRCDTKIALPAVNAEWIGQTSVTETTEDKSACSRYVKDSACTEGELTCTNGTCTRTFHCGGQTVNGCSTLTSLGCTMTTSPTCDSATDATCQIKKGEASCVNVTLPEGLVEDGAVVVTGQTTENAGEPTENRLACDKQLAGLGTCTLVSSTCTDSSSPVRVINGKLYFASCWAYEKVYRCTDSTPVSTCTNLEALKDKGTCVLETDTCTNTTDAGCQESRRVYRCNAGQDDIAAGDAQFIDQTDTITELVHVTDCGDIANDAACTKTGEECLEAGGTKIVNGVAVTKDCWKKRVTYTCGTAGETSVIDTCRELVEREDCRLTESICLGTNAAGECTMTSQTFECGGGSKEIVTGQTCDGTLCVGGVCEAAPEEVSDTFVQGVAVMEVARQAGVYGDVETDAIFKGHASGCSVKAAGFSCCRPENAATGAKMNNAAFGVAMAVGVEAGWELIKYAGSPFVYDVLSLSDSTSGLLTWLYGEAGTGVYSPNFSFYGVSVGTTSAGSLTLNFSPAGFFAALAIDMAVDYFSCTQEDQVHAMRRSQGLCRYVGSYCAKKGGGSCLEKRESWCCFNSRLALTIQEQGRAQLGMGWGTAEAPICRGFTLAEFEQLDFSQMDLTGVVAEMAELAKKTVNAAPVTERALARVDSAVTNHYVPVTTQTGRCATGLEAGCTEDAGLVLADTRPVLLQETIAAIEAIGKE